MVRRAKRRPTYRARGAAKQLFRCNDREVLIEGPVGTGKTRAVLEKIDYICTNYPNVRVLICRKVRATMAESVLETFEAHVLGEGHPAITGTARPENRHSYEYPNGSTVVIGGLDMSSKVMSTEYDIIALFEATEAFRQDWQKLTTRIRNHGIPHPDGMYPEGVLPDGRNVRELFFEGYFEQWGNRCPDGSPLFLEQVIADCNPDDEYHWLNLRARTSMTRLLSRHKDNPALTPEYLANLDTLVGHERDRLRDGLWSTAKGRVYDEFNPDAHLVAHDDVPVCDWYFAAMDFGYRPSPGALGVIGVKGKGAKQRLYIVEEVYRLGMDDDWWAGMAVQLHEQYDLRALICDSAEPDRIAKLNKMLSRGDARHAGAIAIKANKAIKTGIQAVHYYLGRDDTARQAWRAKHNLPATFDLELDLAPHQIAEWGKPPELGDPRLVISRESLQRGACPELTTVEAAPYCLEHEIRALSYPETQEGRPVKDVPDPACVDHACDWLRYACMWVWGKDKQRGEQSNYDPGSIGADAGHDELDKKREADERREAQRKAKARRVAARRAAQQAKKYRGLQ